MGSDVRLGYVHGHDGETSGARVPKWLHVYRVWFIFTLRDIVPKMSCVQSRYDDDNTRGTT